MLDAVCREIKNYFVYNDSDKIIGDFAIVGGQITPSVDIQEGQYYRIVGSAFNDDVYIKGQETLTDERQFRGGIWLMRPPKEFLNLVKDIEDWQNNYGGVNSVLMSPFTSESFGGYSYSKDTGSGGGSNGQSGLTWQSVFANRLSPYRRIRLL